MITLSKSEILPLIHSELAIPAIEEAYRAASAGTANLPPVGHIAFPQNNGDCHVKFGHIAGSAIFVVKIATGFYGNQALGLANGNGLSIVLSAETGIVQAVLHDEGLMTDVRTGIGGAVATRALCRADSRKVAIVGTGVQARYQIRYLQNVLNTPDLDFAIWGRSLEKADAAAGDMRKEGIDVTVADDLETLCRASDIIITTTPATSPLIKADWVAPGCHITAVGADAPGKQELEPELIAKADCVVADLISQCVDHGEISAAVANGLFDQERAIELGDILSGKRVGRQDPEDITIADLTGLAVQDIAIAEVVLDAYHSTLRT